MRLALPTNNLEIAIEDDEHDRTAYVQISTEGEVTVQGAAGETREIELSEDLTLED